MKKYLAFYLVHFNAWSKSVTKAIGAMAYCIMVMVLFQHLFVSQ